MKNTALYIIALLALWASPTYAADQALQALVDEGLSNNPSIKASAATLEALQARIPISSSLPDPMVMLGYQNESWSRFTLGEMPDAQLMFSVSQMFPYPGKRSLKEQTATKEWQAQVERHRKLKLDTISSINETYYSIILTNKTIAIIKERMSLIDKIETMVLSRYSAGKGMAGDALMAQKEKYMLTEKLTMAEQRLRSSEAMLAALLGRESAAGLAMSTEEIEQSALSLSAEEFVEAALANSPELTSMNTMAQASQSMLDMTKLEYYPDTTLTANVGKRTGGLDDMWSLTASFNIPLYARTSQDMAVKSAQSMHRASMANINFMRTMVASKVRDNYAMLKASESLADLYQTGLKPKASHDMQLALGAYTSGAGDAKAVLNAINSYYEYEEFYWQQRVERERALARMQAIGGIDANGQRIE